jgi:hypothetical protein
MPRNDDPVVDTVQNINGVLASHQVDEEDAYVDFDAVYEETSGSFSQFSECQWRFSYELDGDSLEEPVEDEWEAFTDAGEDFARDTYRSIVDAVEEEFPEMDVEYTPVEEAVETYRELEN